MKYGSLIGWHCSLSDDISLLALIYPESAFPDIAETSAAANSPAEE
jgi:hypothetical protein